MRKLLILPFILVSFFSGCGLDNKTEESPGLVIEGYNPPKFRVSGHGSLDVITVGGPDMERKAPEGAAPYSKEYWVIMPRGKYDLSRMSSTGPITYGQIPEGFEQWVPRGGAALPLVEGETYYIQLRTKEGRAVSRAFVLRDGKIIATGDGN